MSTSDLVDLPANMSHQETGIDGQPRIVDTPIEDYNTTTTSHVLADADHDEKGAAQRDRGDPEGEEDLGWNQDAEAVPTPLIGGLSNEDLWTLIRRFDKQVFHVKSISDAPVWLPLQRKLSVGCNDQFTDPINSWPTWI